MPRNDYGSRLEGYVEVKDRIRMFYEAHPDGRLVTAEVRWPEPMDDMPRVSVKALAYRDPADPLPGVGWSWMVLPGSTPYTKGSELENTETSAWGRAIGALGIGIDRSIATSTEIAAKAGEQSRVPAPGRTDDGGLIGIVEKGTSKDSDLGLRETPDGWGIGFKLKANGRGGIKVIARDALAQAIASWSTQLVGQRVTCWGSIRDETFTPKNSTRKVTYQVLDLARLSTPDFTLPAVSVAAGEPVDALSEPLFELDPEERDAIAAGLPE